MNNVRKLSALVLCFAMLTAVSACGKQKENPDLLTDEIAAITDAIEESTEESTAEASTEAPTLATLASGTADASETQGPTIAPAPPTTTPQSTIPAPTPAPKATAAPTPAPTAAATAAPAPAAVPTAAATTPPAAATQPVVPVPSEAAITPASPGDPVEVPLVPGETTASVLPVATEAPAAGVPGVPPMPNLSLNIIDESGGRLTANGTDLYIGGNVEAFISVNPPLRQAADPNSRLINGQQVKCIEYSYSDYVIVCNESDHSVLYIDLSGPSIQTSKGIHVGSTVEEVTAAYGAGQTYPFGSNTLSFNFRDGIVNMITIGVQ